MCSQRWGGDDVKFCKRSTWSPIVCWRIHTLFFPLLLLRCLSAYIKQASVKLPSSLSTPKQKVSKPTVGIFESFLEKWNRASRESLGSKGLKWFPWFQFILVTCLSSVLPCVFSSSMSKWWVFLQEFSPVSFVFGELNGWMLLSVS